MDWSKSVTNNLNKCLNFVQGHFAQNCLLCGGASGARLLCHPCFATLPRLETTRACPVCAAPDILGVCGQCLQQPPHFSHSVAALHYTFPVDQLIQAYKYHQQLALAPLFAQCLCDAVQSQPRPDLLLPMPLHPLRLRERGFNQTLEITRIVSKTLSLPFDTHMAKRVVNTAAQAALDGESRRKNMRGAFACSEQVAGRHIAVLDDVMTSGATLNALCETLQKAGAAKLSVWVVARAQLNY